MATQGPKGACVQGSLEPERRVDPGVITVQVLRSAADLKSLPARMLKTDTCAGFPTSYLTVKSRNVVATYTSCFTLSSPIHLATQPVLGGFVAAMQSLR
jgi:hypothetical protein